MINENKTSRRELIKSLGMVAGVTLLQKPELFVQNAKLHYRKPLPVLIKTGQGERAANSSTSYIKKISKEHTKGAYSSVETTLKNGYLGAPPHLHSELDEMVYVLDGTLTVMVGNQIVNVEAGSWHFRPRKLIHAFWNNCGKDVRFIDMFLPGGFEEYLFKMCAVYKQFGKIEPNEVDKFIKNFDIEVHFELLPLILKQYDLRF